MPDSAYPGFPEQAADLLTRLEDCTGLPTPPGIAEKILTLAEDPASSISDFASAVRVDAALSARLLQLANSPVYGLSREVYDVRHAITVLGLEATLSNALSIALVASIREQQSSALDFRGFWRRSLGSASANRLLARHTRAPVAEQYFMAGLLQDIGMVALAEIDAGVYLGLGRQQCDHVRLVAEEAAIFDFDHAVVGAWLIRRWKLPELYAQATLGSHAPDQSTFDPENASLVYCTATSGAIADVIYSGKPAAAVRRALALGAKDRTHLSAAALANVLNRLVAELKELGSLFELDLGKPAWLDEQLQSGLREVDALSGEAVPRSG